MHTNYLRTRIMAVRGCWFSCLLEPVWSVNWFKLWAYFNALKRRNSRSFLFLNPAYYLPLLLQGKPEVRNSIWLPLCAQHLEPSLWYPDHQPCFARHSSHMASWISASPPTPRVLSHLRLFTPAATSSSSYLVFLPSFRFLLNWHFWRCPDVWLSCGPHGPITLSALTLLHPSLHYYCLT